MKTKTRNLFLILIIICLIALGIFFVLFAKNRDSDSLVNFMPRQAEFFVEYNLQDKNLSKFKENNFRGQARLETLFNNINFFGQLSQHLIEKTNKIALMVVPDENQNWQKIWLIRTKNIHHLSALLPAEHFHSNLDSTTLAVSTSRDVIRNIKQVNLLEHTPNQLRYLNKFDNKNFVNLYVSGNYLKFLADKNDPTYFLILKNFDLNYEHAAWLGLRAEKNKIKLFFEAEKNQESSDKIFNTSNADTLKFLELDSAYLKLASADLNFLISKLDQELFSQDKINSWQEKYGLDWQDIEDLKEQPILILIENNNSQIENFDVLDLKQNSYAIIITTDYSEEKMSEQQEKIQEIVKNILSYKYPSQQKIKLADGTHTTQTIANPEIFTFKTTDQIKSISYRDFDFALTNLDNYLILSNDTGLLQQILTSNFTTNKDFSDLTSQKISEIIKIDSQRLMFGVLSFIDQILIKISHSRLHLNLTADLMW